MAETTDSHPKWYTKSPETVGQELQVDPTEGLSAAMAQQRLEHYGPNHMAEKKKEPDVSSCG